MSISIHALLAESDRLCPVCQWRRSLNFYPRSPCGERPCAPSANGAGPSISIHALLAESDQVIQRYPPPRRDISIHALLAESDRRAHVQPPHAAISIHALPRLPMAPISHFYPRSPCGERPLVTTHAYNHAYISIHALLAESDTLACASRLSASISIHALLAESDLRPKKSKKPHNNFYPRSPCGERRRSCPSCPAVRSHHFYPRSPCGERLPRILCRSRRRSHFYPRSPCGERPPSGIRGPARYSKFLSTLSLRRATIYGWNFKGLFEISIHALLAESDSRRF